MEDKEIAVGSANFHRTHFSKPYNIRLDNGNYAYSACFAFGVERLTYACNFKNYSCKVLLNRV